MAAGTKASSPTKATKPSHGFSEAESKLICIAFKHMNGVPDIEWDAVATEYGYKDAALARSKYRLAMNKHSKPASGDDNGDGAKASTESTGIAETKPKATPRKRKAVEVDDDEEAKVTPTKRGRKPANKDTGGEGKTTPAKRGRKPKSAPAVKEEDTEKTSTKEDSSAAVDEIDVKEEKGEENEEVSKEAGEAHGKESDEEYGKEAEDEDANESGEIVEEV